MISIFNSLNDQNRPTFWTPVKESVEMILNKRIFEGILWELVKPETIKKRCIVVSGNSFYMLEDDLKIIKKMAYLQWKLVEPFSETNNSKTRFGFRLQQGQVKKDFYVESQNGLDS